MAARDMTVSVTVNINGKQASQQVDDLEKKSTNSFKRVARAGAAVLGFFYGGIAQQARAAVARTGDILGRGTPIGAIASQFWGRVGAANTATDRSVESMGIAGKGASKETILAIYNMHKMMETMRADSKSRVEAVIGEQRWNEMQGSMTKDLIFALKNLGTVVKELGRVGKLY